MLFGLNGCGKTTLLSILAGYQSGNEGSNYLFGEKWIKPIMPSYANGLVL